MNKEAVLEPESPEINSTEDPNLDVCNNNEKDNAATEPRPLTKRQQLLLMAAFCFCNFSMGTGYAMLAPFFPQEALNKGASYTIYGLIIGCYQLVVIMMAPIYGKLAPIISPDLLACSGIFISGVAQILFGILEWSPTGVTFIVLAFVIRSFDAIGWSSYFTSSYTIVAMSFTEKKATCLSILETIFGLGMITGPTLGGALYQLGGYFLPFATLGSVLVLGSIASFAIIPTIHNVESDSRGTLRVLMKNPSYLVTLYICATSFLGLGFNDATLEPHLRQFQLKPVVLGTIFVVFGGIYAVCSPIWGYLCDRIRNTLTLCAIGSTFAFIGFLLIGPVPFIPLPTTLWLVCVAQVLLGIGMSAKLICGFLYAMQVAIDSGLPNNLATYGAVFGTVTAALSLGAFFGPFLGGSLLDNVSYNEASLYVAGFELITATITWICAIIQAKKNARREKSDEERPLLAET